MCVFIAHNSAELTLLGPFAEDVQNSMTTTSHEAYGYNKLDSMEEIKHGALRSQRPLRLIKDGEFFFFFFGGGFYT